MSSISARSAPLLVPSRRDRDEKSAERKAVQVRHDVENVDRQAANPAARHDAPLANIGGDDRAARDRAQPSTRATPARSEPTRPEHDANTRRRRPAVRSDRSTRLRRQTWTSNRAVAHDLLDEQGIRTRPSERVTVDDVDPTKSNGRPTTRATSIGPSPMEIRLARSHVAGATHEPRGAPVGDAEHPGSNRSSRAWHHKPLRA